MKSDGTVEYIAGPWSLAQELTPWRESSDKHLLPDTTLPSPLPPLLPSTPWAGVG